MNINLRRIIELADEFLKIPSIIGHEKPFLNHLNEKLLRIGYITEITDNYLVVKSKFENPKYLYSAHCDRHGLIRNDDGNIEFAALYLKKKLDITFKRDILDIKEKSFYNFLDKENIKFCENGKFLKFLDFDVRFEKEATSSFFEKICYRYVNDGVFSYNTFNGDDIDNARIERFDSDWKNKLVTFDLSKDIGGEVFAFDSFIKMSKNKFYGQIDNVISIAVLVYLLEIDKLDGEVIFTTQEEIGCSWNNIIDYLDKRNNNLDLIVLDTSPYENFEDKDTGFLVLREGDENGSFNLDLLNKVKTIVNDLNIPVVFKPKDTGMTELGRISTESKGKYNGITLQLPSMNYHTTYETSTLESLENYVKVILNLK